jgi:hypothetical protein
MNGVGCLFGLPTIKEEEPVKVMPKKEDFIRRM